jgi:hypothetical protein
MNHRQRRAALKEARKEKRIEFKRLAEEIDQEN